MAGRGFTRPGWLAEASPGPAGWQKLYQARLHQARLAGRSFTRLGWLAEALPGPASPGPAGWQKLCQARLRPARLAGRSFTRPCWLAEALPGPASPGPAGWQKLYQARLHPALLAGRSFARPGFARPCWLAEALPGPAGWQSNYVLSSSIHLSVCSFVCYQICKHNIWKMNQPILMPISTNFPRGKNTKRSTSGVRNSKVTGGRGQEVRGQGHMRQI